MKAIIEVARRDSIFDAALTDVESGGNPDCVLAFESARALFAEITPARLDLLDALRRGERAACTRWPRRLAAITRTCTPTSAS
jgi:hypothetical protein